MRTSFLAGLGLLMAGMSLQSAKAKPSFPLQVSKNRRYLEDLSL
ncbi:MAG TPA: hypothetical protein VHI52_21490 [Verrucomicrobiae bacterium]|nr:hypothetical protein [Verrucomicrobiae bacterium]